MNSNLSLQNNKKKTTGLRLCFETVILSILTIAFAFLLLFPFIVLVLKSFGISLFTESNFTLAHYGSVLMHRKTWLSLKNSLSISILVVVFTLLLGGFFAFLTTRTNFKHKKLIQTCVFLSFTIPSYVLALSFIELFGRNGYMQRIYEFFHIQHGMMNPYSILSCAIVLTMHMYPMVYFALCNALKRSDSTLEDMAVMSGASRMRAIKNITIPMILPSVFAISLFVFSRSLANFSVPSLLLMPLYKETLTTGIYRSLNNLDLQTATVQAFLLLVLAVLLFFVEHKILKKYKYVTSKSDKEVSKFSLKHETLTTTIVTIILFFVSIVPLFVVVSASFLKYWGLPLRIENMTFANYSRVFHQEIAMRAFKNSFVYGLIACLLAVIFTCLISAMQSYSSHKWIRKIALVLESIAGWSMSFPNIVMALAAILAWSNEPFYFYGKSTIIILTWCGLFLPICLKHITGINTTIDSTYMDVARISGASVMKGYKDVVLPQLMPGIQTAFVMCLLISLREIPIALMLHSVNTETAGVLLYNMRSNSCGLEATSTIAVIVILLSMIGRLCIVGIKRKKVQHEV